MIVQRLKTQLLDRLARGSDPVQGWVKTVTAIDSTRTNGYMYVGEFLNDEPFELPAHPRVVLAHGAYRDDSDPDRPVVMRSFVRLSYVAGVLSPDGQVVRTAVAREFPLGRAANKWALVMREEMAELLARAAGEEVANLLAGFDDLQLLAEMARRGYLIRRSQASADPDVDLLESVREVRRHLQQLGVVP